MTYDNLALALVQESTYNIEDEINNFNKICESINILNENNILLEEVDINKFKEKAINALTKIKNAIIDFIDKIKKFIKNIINKIKERFRTIKNIYSLIKDASQIAKCIKNESDYYTNENASELNFSFSNSYDQFMNQVSEFYNPRCGIYIMKMHSKYTSIERFKEQVNTWQEKCNITLEEYLCRTKDGDFQKFISDFDDILENDIKLFKDKIKELEKSISDLKNINYYNYTSYNDAIKDKSYNNNSIKKYGVEMIDYNGSISVCNYAMEIYKNISSEYLSVTNSVKLWLEYYIDKNKK